MRQFIGSEDIPYQMWYNIIVYEKNKDELGQNSEFLFSKMDPWHRIKLPCRLNVTVSFQTVKNLNLHDFYLWKKIDIITCVQYTLCSQSSGFYK